MEGSLDLKPSIRAVLHAALKCKNKDAGDSPRTWRRDHSSRSVRSQMSSNTRLMLIRESGSLKNIAAHYDLSNAFYELWLDETLTYSSALFDDHSPTYLREGRVTGWMTVAEVL